MGASLRLLTGPFKGRIIPLRLDEPLRVGRDPACELSVNEPNVSRLHAEFLWDAGALTVNNRSSTNGIFVNGLRQDQAKLKEWDTVVVGSTLMRVEGLASAMAAATTIEPATDPPTTGFIARAQRSLTREGELPELKDQGQLPALLSCLMAIQKILASDQERMIEQSLDTLFTALPVTRLCLFEVVGGDLKQGYTSSKNGRPTYMSHSFARKVLESQCAVLMEEVGNVAQDWGRTIQEQEVRSIIGVPVLVNSAIRFIILCDNLEKPAALKEAHLQILELVGRALENVFQREELRRLEGQRRLVEHEQQAAKRVQDQIFTKRPEQIVGSSRWLSHWQPALTLGGDFYDYDQRDDAVFWVLADVSGKGLPAALVVSMLKAFCKVLYPRRLKPRAFLEALNVLCLGELPPSMFLTAVVIELTNAGHLSGFNIGHPPGAIIAPDGSVRRIEACPGIIGMMELDRFSEHFVEIDCQLVAGERIILVTDGVIEAHAGDEANFGDNALVEVLRSQATAPLAGMRDALLASLAKHTHGAAQYDDVTLVMGEYLG
ncbi:MAG: SpoIIE family protein phosphatase [Planctomycetes bacterium]|nr:SpoIIE family protein phosphatase [Planctomycetota bacterium]